MTFRKACKNKYCKPLSDEITLRSRRPRICQGSKYFRHADRQDVQCQRPCAGNQRKNGERFQMAEKGKVANKRIETVHPDLNFRTAGQQLLVYEVPGFTVDGRRGL